MSTAATQQMMMTIMSNVQLAQQEQQRRNNDYNEQSFKRMVQNDRRRVSRESMLAGQTLEQRHLMHLVLTPVDVYQETPEFEFSNLVFSPKMKLLVESKNLVNGLNQVRQHTKHFSCSPNKPLFFQFLWTQGCLPSGGMAVGGLTIFMMISGYTYETAKELALQHDISMRIGEEGSDKDFHSLLGKENIVTPLNEHKGLIMLQSMAEFLVLMVDGPCIASSGYALAAELWAQYSQEIHQLTRDSRESHFLLRLLNQIDQENHLLFKDLFNDIQETGPGLYCLKTSMVHKRDERL